MFCNLLLKANRPHLVFYQGSKGIRQWPINWCNCTTPMMINKISPSVDYNHWLKRFNTQLSKQTNKNSINSPKLLSQQIRKKYYKTLGTSVINSPMSPPSLDLLMFVVIIYLCPGTLEGLLNWVPWAVLYKHSWYPFQ